MSLENASPTFLGPICSGNHGAASRSPPLTSSTFFLLDLSLGAQEREAPFSSTVYSGVESLEGCLCEEGSKIVRGVHPGGLAAASGSNMTGTWRAFVLEPAGQWGEKEEAQPPLLRVGMPGPSLPALQTEAVRAQGMSFRPRVAGAVCTGANLPSLPLFANAQCLVTWVPIF